MNSLQLFVVDFDTVLVLMMAHRKWRETKQLPSMLPGSAVPGCCLVSFHFLWSILWLHTVLSDGEDSRQIPRDGRLDIADKRGKKFRRRKKPRIQRSNLFLTSRCRSLTYFIPQEDLEGVFVCFRLSTAATSFYCQFPARESI